MAGIVKWPEPCQGAGNINDAWRNWVLRVQANKTIPSQWLQNEADLTPNLLKKLEYHWKQVLKMPRICDSISDLHNALTKSCAKSIVWTTVKSKVLSLQEMMPLWKCCQFLQDWWELCPGECWKHQVIEAISSDGRSPSSTSKFQPRQMKAHNDNSLTIQMGNIPGFSLL